MISFLRKIRKSLIKSGSARRYLLYSIGEIALVVIGILLALQVNNWNERRKNNSRLKAIIPGLLAEIRHDSVEISNTMVTLGAELELLRQFEFRLNQEESSVDTLIQIAKNEFTPGVNDVALFMNNVTYTTLIQSGEISLFPNHFVQAINEYYMLYNQLNRTDQHSWTLYTSAVSQYLDVFTFNGSFISNGPINEAIWENPDIQVLGPKFGKFANIKRLYMRTLKGHLEPMVEKNEHLITQLKKIQVGM